ncbi:hypothetical protein ASG98_17025 [Bacillus sp. Soil531]|nr:hypothetical protein ASG98_17025 [Bacillus sp. Soil531]
MRNQNKIVLDPPKVRGGNKIYCHFKCSGKVSKYFNENNFYMKLNANVESVPQSILIIPALSNICPVAWVTGTDIYVEEIDQEFLEALNTVKKSFQKLYPKHSFKGDIKYKKIKENKGYGKKKSGLFFSGGADSVASYIRKRHEKPYLLTVLGADIPLSENEGWGRVKSHTNQFAKMHKLTPLFIQSNLRSFLNERNLNKSYSKHGLRGWWGGIQHGLGLVGLSAPLTFIKGMNKIHFASTPLLSHNNTLYSTSWGSHPSIENNLKWGDTQVALDGTHLNRFDKIGIIAKYIKKNGSNLQLRVCWESKKGSNCGKCEKCARTMANLLSEGLNPSNHGFRMNKNLLKSMKKNKKSFMKLNKPQWKIIQKKLSNKIPDADSEYYDFCQWIVKVNFQRKRKDFFS